MSDPLPGGPATSLTLRDALDDPALAAARPRLLSGAERLDTPVRWVHTSEVLDIADLLSGGEMLLVAGVMLAACDEAALRAYVDSLADVGVAALAVERPRIGALGATLAEHARRRGLPLVELTEVVRFVEVTRALNSRLVHESVRALHFNDEVTHTLAEVLAGRGDLDDMVDALSRLSGCSITVRSVAGAVLAAAEVPDARPHGYAESVPVDSAGVTIATLEVRPRPGVDLQMISAVRRRAPESLALGLLQRRPLTRSDHAVRDVFGLMGVLGDTSRSPAQRAETTAALARATEALGWPPGGTYVGVVALAVRGPLHVAELDAVLRRDGRHVLSEIRDGRQRSVVRFEGRPRGGRPAEALAHLVDQLYSSALPAALRVGLTEPCADLAAVAATLGTAATAAARAPEHHHVGLARDATLDHFVAALAPEDVERFLDAALGPLRSASRGPELLETLAALLRTGSRVAAAQALGIHRQTLYQRLDRVEALLGRPWARDDGATAALRVAVEIAARR